MLFFAIPKELTEKYDFNGVLLFIILASCLIMTWSLIKHKKNIEVAENDDLYEGETEEALEDYKLDEYDSEN